MSDYHTGWPEKQGWYDCIVDGELDRLRHWICGISGRHEWIDVDGQYIKRENHDIMWTGEPSVRYM